MATGWVIDHPAHARLLAPMMRELSSTDDVIIACDRFEVRAMMENCDGHMPRRRIVWVPRPIGKGRWRKAWKRAKIARKTLKRVDQVVSIGAPIELRVAPRKAKRIYITDTEVNHLAHRLARPTDIIIPTHFIDSLASPLMTKKAKFHRINGLHGHIHLHPKILPEKISDPPKILVRRLVGDGTHDADELLPIPENWLEGLTINRADENEVEGNPWDLDGLIASMDGVITQSVTIASEAVLLGIPTLLVSKAVRGFLDRLIEDGYPLFIAREHDESILAAWLAGLHLTDSLEIPEWPNTKSEMLDLLKH
jgi:predicted glycosyltransferase